MSIISVISRDFPNIEVSAGAHAHWSPSNNSVAYTEDDDEDQSAISLLHEIAHAELNHNSYKLDVELLLMEVAAWDLAKKLAAKYGLVIDEDKIEDCLDTYRDWVYQRGICPACSSGGLQQDSRNYLCFNCQTTWQVSKSRFCRAYRMSKGMENEI